MAWDHENGISGRRAVTRGASEPKGARASRAKLEEWVRERTAELEEIKRALRIEIAEREKAEEALRESEERFRLMVEFTSGWEEWLGPDGRYVYVSPACRRVTGFGPAEFMADPGMLTRIIHPDDQEAFSDHCCRGWEGWEGPLSIHFRIITRGGETRWISHVCQPVFSSDWKFLGRRASNHDITDRKRAEAEARLRQEQLYQADKMATLGALVAGVAHEINNPNAFIVSNAPALEKIWKAVLPILDQRVADEGDFLVDRTTYGEIREDVPVLLEGIREGAARIKRIVTSLKDFARYERPDFKELVDLNAVADAAVLLLNNLIKKRTNRFVLSKARNLPKILGSRQRLEQVIINLVVNALQALPDKDRQIQVATGAGPDQGSVWVMVQDEGVGLAKELIPRIFDPFFTTKRDQDGTGLGLSIAASIVQEHHGRITVKSSPGQGATFTVELPAQGLEPGEGKRS